MGDTNCSNVLRQGIGVYFPKGLVKKLRNTKFSLIPDETTNIFIEKQLGIVAYFNYENMNTNSVLWLNTREGLFDAIQQSLQDKNIAPKNVIAYSSDTMNVMFGDRGSVVTWLNTWLVLSLPDVVAV